MPPVAKKRSRTANAKSDERPGTSRYAVEAQIGHLLRRAHQRHCANFAESMPDDLTPQQFAALAMIGQLGTVSQNELGRRTAMDPATIQGVVKRLGGRKLVKSGPDTADRRRHVWQLTAAGKRILNRIVPAAADISAATLEPLTASERRNLLKLLIKIG